ncbi:MAG: M48 family metalloprotease [Waterburya sp.]
MKSLKFCLVILNIFIFSGVTLAEPASNISSQTASHPSIINHPNLKSETTSNEVKSDDSEADTESKAENSENTGENSESETESEAEAKTDEATSEDRQTDPESETENTEDTDDTKPKPEESETKAKPDKPTPKEIARLKKLAKADQLYLLGDKAAASKLYREAKEVWQIEREQATNKQDESVKPFEDPAQLSPAGKVFWRNYQEGKKQQLESKIISALKLLTTREPQFIPGHIHYATTLKQYEKPAESTQVLNRAINLYPNEPQLLKAKIDADIAAENWLEASIVARQFALFNPDLPAAKEFNRLAEQYLAEYQSNLRSKITWNAIGNAIAGTVGFALTGNLFGPLSAIETTSLLLKGESGVGESTVKQAKEQLPLLENAEVSQYVTQIGQKVAAASGREEFNYQFYVIMDDQLNAFALPGGKVFVNAGAIMNTDTEAELAGLLAHEVAHAALSHGFQLITQGNLTANIVSYIPYVGNTASSLIVLNYSREMEKQADTFGTRILVNAGYAADGVRNLMAKLAKSNQEQDNPEPPAWLSSHPNSQQRIEYMEKLIVDNNLNRYQYEGVARHQEVKTLMTARWQEYEKCTKDVEDIEKAKECAGNKKPKTEDDSQN